MANGRGSLDWAGGTGRALSLHFPHLHLPHPPFSFSLPCPGTWSSPSMPCCLLPALPAKDRTTGSRPSRQSWGVRAWHISPHFFCSSIIDRISSACCTRCTHGIFCSNGAARFPRPSPAHQARGAREREGAATRCPGHRQGRASHPSLQRIPRPGTLGSRGSSPLPVQTQPRRARCGVELVSTDATLPSTPGAASGQEESTIYGQSWAPSLLPRHIQRSRRG